MLPRPLMVVIPLLLLLIALAATHQPPVSHAQATVTQVREMYPSDSINLYAVVTGQSGDATSLTWAAYWAKSGRLLKGNLFSNCQPVNPLPHRQCLIFTAPKTTGLVRVEVWPSDNKDGASSTTFRVIPAPSPRP